MISGGVRPAPSHRHSGRPPAPAGESAVSRAGPKTREQRRAEARARAAKSAGLKHLRARVAALEQEIGELETRQGELTAQLESAATYAEPGKPVALNRELSGVVDRLHAATTEWEDAAGELEALEKPPIDSPADPSDAAGGD